MVHCPQQVQAGGPGRVFCPGKTGIAFQHMISCWYVAAVEVFVPSLDVATTINGLSAGGVAVALCASSGKHGIYSSSFAMHLTVALSLPGATTPAWWWVLGIWHT